MVDKARMPPRVSIIVPTLREVANIPPLAEQIVAAMAGRDYEIVVVDDNSRDGTDKKCEELAAAGVPIRCLTRVGSRDGLGGAVLHGLRNATGDVLVVMDADLQHPPSRLPALIDAVAVGGAEFAVGSREVEGGSTSGDWPLSRRITSKVAASLARPFAGDLRDVMSGFFALPRSVFERGEHLAPLGFKIGLELICKCRVTKLVEVPIHFGVRTEGESKLDVKEKFRYLEHLSRLYDFTYPRAGPVLKFAVVTTLSLLVGLVAFELLRIGGAIPRWLAATLAYSVSLGVTAMFHARYVRTQRDYLIRPNPWLDFAISCAAELLACLATALYLDRRLSGPTAAEIFVIAFGIAILVRYILRKELMLDVRGLRFIPPLPRR
jgi:dolichol-phosphate mannosyltransferase